MIAISYTKPDELYIWGSIKELQDIVINFSNLVKGINNEFKVKAKKIEPTPYDNSLEYLTVKVTNGPTKISVIDNEVLVEGSINSMSSLLTFFDFENSSSKGDHSHHEYFFGNEYIHPDSIPTIIGVE